MDLPRWIHALPAKVHSIFRRARAEQELDEELSFHLAMQTRAAEDRGLSRAEAERSARLDLQGLQQTKERSRDVWPLRWADDLLQDFRYALRGLCRAPGFAAVAILSLALGIGANTALFSVVNAVMLRPLPYPDADRLVRIWESNPEVGRLAASTSQPNFLDWHARSRAFSALAATTGAFAVIFDQGAETVSAQRITADFLSVLDVPPALGRNFMADEYRPGVDVRVAILSDGFWQRRFASDLSILGRQIPLGGVPYTIVGVLPPSFRWHTDNVDVWLPLALNPAASRGDRQLEVIGRVRDGVTIERAHNELAGIAAALAEQYPDADTGWSVRTLSFYDWLIPGAIRYSLVILLAAVAVVLLIACANVASLLLARAAGRQQELSTRVALGAARSRIVRQLLTESLLLSLIAGLAGIASGGAAARLLVTYGPGTIPRLAETSFDLNVLLFALAATVTTVLVFGVMPAMQVSRQCPAAALQEGARGSGGGGRQRARSLLTVIEVALSVVLLIGAGLLLRSLWRLQRVDPGFNASPVMMARVLLPPSTYPTSQARGAFYERLLPEIEALPGVGAAAISSGVPLAGGNFQTEFHIPATGPRASAQNSAGWRLVSPGYFVAMGIPLRGRELSWRDRENPLRTIIISETMARQYWPHQDPIGQTVILDTFSASAGNRARTIIGVAGDVRHVGLDTEPRATVYYSTVEIGALGPMGIVWRSSADPASHVPVVRDLIRRIDPTVVLLRVQSLADLLTNSFAPRKFNMYLLSVFAGVALFLAAIGLFGITAYLVSQRTREIGLRLALGADRRDIYRLILGRGIALAATGAAIGVCAAFWLTRVLQSLVFSVSTTDPGTFAAVPTLLVLVALLACYIPARRATRVDPTVALRAQ